MARYVHRKSQPRRQAVHLGQLRRHPREPAGIANCSATRRAPSPAPSPAASASSRKPMAARCCSTKSARWTPACRPSCCAPSRSARSTASAAPSRSRSTSASSPPPTATWPRRCKHGTFREDLLYRLNVVNLRLPAAARAAQGHPARWPITSRANTPRPTACRTAPLSAETERLLLAPSLARQRARAGKHHAPRRAAGARAPRSSRKPSACRTARRSASAGTHRRRRCRAPVDAADAATTRALGRPHRRRCRARPDPRHAGPLPRQPHPCRQHPRHLDPHPAQQAAGIFRGRASRVPQPRRSSALAG